MMKVGKVLFVDTLVINQCINIHSLPAGWPTLIDITGPSIYKTYGIMEYFYQRIC